MNENKVFHGGLILGFLISLPLSPMDSKQTASTNHNTAQCNKNVQLIKPAQSVVPFGHVPCAGSCLLNDHHNPVTIWLIDRYCKQNEINRCTVLEGHTNTAMALAITPDAKHCVIGSYDTTAGVWNLKTGKLVLPLKGPSIHLRSIAITSNGLCCVTGSWDSIARVWNLSSGECIRKLEGHTGLVSAVAITPDGKLGVTSSMDNNAHVWYLETGECACNLEGHVGFVSAIAITHDGTHCATGSWDTTARIWNIKNAQCIRILEGHTSCISAIALVSDVNRCVTGSCDHTARAWNIATEECIHILNGHTNNVSAVAITGHGKHCATGSADNTVRIWNLETGQCIHILKGHTKCVEAIAITPDGKHCVTGADDSTVRTWRLGIPKQLHKILRQLTLAQSTLLMDIYASVQRNHPESIRSHDANGCQTDTYYAYDTLAPDIKKLIDPYLHINNTAPDKKNLSISQITSQIQPGVALRTLSLIQNHPYTTSTMTAFTVGTAILFHLLMHYL